MSKERGQAVVEFALVLPVVLLLLLGILEFGRVYGAYLLVENGAREGARVAMLGGNDQAVRQRVQEVTATLDPSRLTVTVIRQGDSVTVQVGYDWPVQIPFIAQIVGSNLRLGAAMTMRLETVT